MKLEQDTEKARIPHEMMIYSELKGVDGIPRVMGFRRWQGHNVLIMENAGIALSEFFHRQRHSWSREATRYLASFFAHEMVRTMLLL